MILGIGLSRDVFINSLSWTAELSAIYAPSQVLRETVACFLVAQDTGDTFIKWICPDIDLRSADLA